MTAIGAPPPLPGDDSENLSPLLAAISDCLIVCGLSRFLHSVQRRTGQKSRAGLTLLAGVGIDRTKYAPRQCDVNPSGFISKLAHIDVDNRPCPAAVATPASQLFNGGRLREGLAVIQQ